MTTDSAKRLAEQDRLETEFKADPDWNLVAEHLRERGTLGDLLEAVWAQRPHLEVIQLAITQCAREYAKRRGNARDIPLEHAEHLATSAEQYIIAVKEVAVKQAVIDCAINYDARLPLTLDQLERARDEETDALRQLESALHEWREAGK